ncbi:hypothetical protein Mal64_07920 [Pseudobythopirellula maris]|uniref:Uncharacterized protein n=1 Tax=Pseudobythopirellula maris TaxID=2527991 RepID=A0A5C5ZVX8_9BACT|nr:hypothetical protein [Pseudobythopirellula maris]TWT90403.1 hypothetical protein Mal64_07920 [Pseudobythopirellula maris]
MTPRNNRRRRPAFVMIAALALLVIASALAVGWTTEVIRGRRQTRTLLMQRQAERLTEAALGRAAARLRADAGYDGETWRLTNADLGQSYADLGQSYAAEVFVRIDPATDAAERRVVAQAVLPPGDAARVRHTATLDLPSPNDPPTSAGDSAP